MFADAAYWLLLAALGLTVGSLLNVVCWRLPLMITAQAPAGFNLWLPASHCPQCQTPLKWRDNIPLISWLRLQGRCRHCRQRIAVRYPLMEGVTLLLTLAVSAIFPCGPLLLAALLLSWLLLPLMVIDAEHQLLPDLLTLGLLWLGLLANLLAWLPAVTLHASVAGAITGYGVLALLAHGWYWLRGKEALGLGDAKLLAALGAWLGWQRLPELLLLASIGGIGWALMARLLWRRPLSAALPFGPFLAVAGWLLWLSGNR